MDNIVAESERLSVDWSRERGVDLGHRARGTGASDRVRRDAISRSGPLLHKMLQHHCFVVLLVASSVEQGEAAPFDFALEHGDLLGMVPQFGVIASPETSPFRDVVGKPLSEVRGWGDFFQPEIHVGASLRQTARPKPVHEDAGAIAGIRRVVNPLHPNLHRSTSRPYAAASARGKSTLFSLWMC